ncbi:hypothetical protein ACX80W_10945 [Arthrobacter sp. TMN-37]
MALQSYTHIAPILGIAEVPDTSISVVLAAHGFAGIAVLMMTGQDHDILAHPAHDGGNHTGG